MGRIASAPSPISVTKTLSTVAKIGLSMKLWVMEGSCFDPDVSASALTVRGGVVMEGAVLRRDLGAGNGAHQAIDDDAVARLKARLDHAQAAAKIACCHDLGLHG